MRWRFAIDAQVFADRQDIQPAYLVVAAVLLIVVLVCIQMTRGLPAVPQGRTEQSRTDGRSGEGWSWVLRNRRIRFLSVGYFFLKMTRYTLLFWLPHYLISSAGCTTWSAARIASCFELFGIVGPIAVACALKRWVSGSSMQMGATILFGLAFACLLHPLLAGSGLLGLVVSVSLMGMLVHGADLLVSGMAVLDSAPSPVHGRAVGFVNGIGSVGQAISPLLATLFVAHYGWARLFDVFVLFAVLSGVICLLGRDDKPVKHRELTVQPMSSSGLRSKLIS